MGSKKKKEKPQQAPGKKENFWGNEVRTVTIISLLPPNIGKTRLGLRSSLVRKLRRKKIGGVVKVRSQKGGKKEDCDLREKNGH